MEKADPYKDQAWDSMHFEEKQCVKELLEAFEVLGAGKSAQLLYQQFLCSKTIHGYAPVDTENVYRSTFDAFEQEHTTVMPVPTTEKNVKEMIRLASMFHAYRMLGHALSRTASMDTISRHYKQFSTDLMKLSRSAEERSKVQKLEGLPASVDQAFWEARLEHATEAFELLSEHRDQYDQILERGSLDVVLVGWDCAWSSRICVLASAETLTTLLLKKKRMPSRLEWKPFVLKAVKLKAVFKMPEVPASLKAMEDDEEANRPPTKKRTANEIEPPPAKNPKTKKTKKTKKKKKNKITTSDARSMARERAKVRAKNASGGAKMNKAAKKGVRVLPGGTNKKKKKDKPDPSMELTALLAAME